MIKRVLLFVALSFSFMMVAAQTVSDDQVVKMIMAEKKSGSDEAAIAQKLLSKGVTPAQLRRIKEKYEHQDDIVYYMRNYGKPGMAAPIKE